MIVKQNSENKKVKKIQELLGINTDGFFGEETKEKVEKFQKQKDIKDDGVVGPKTWRLLLTHEQNNIRPVFQDFSFEEDESDPDEKMDVDTDLNDDGIPDSDDAIELFNVIDKSKIKRNIKRLVFHCTATSQKASVSSIINYWKNNLGWNNPGYHIIVKPDGSWTQLLDFNKISNGVKGVNSTTINVSYIGGIDENGAPLDNRTKEQKEIYEIVYYAFKEKLDITFHGHNEFDSKACPSYDVKKWIKKIDE